MKRLQFSFGNRSSVQRAWLEGELTGKTFSKHLWGLC
jgi:hypothetical protein